MTRLRCQSIPLSGLIGLILSALIAPTTSWAVQHQTSYGFVRVIEGRADLMQASSSTLIELVENYPLMVGDEIRVPYGSRVETVLPDGTYLRLDGDSELSFQNLALSADTEDGLSVLELPQGEIQLVLSSDTTSSEAFRVDTQNASIYLQNRGSYRIRSHGSGWSEIVVREGFAEVVTDQGSTIVRSGEQTLVEGDTSPLVRVERAGVRDDLERWGDNLLAQVGPSDSRHVDPSLAYASTPLAQNGHWITVGSRTAWRPNTTSGWRPYNAGWWVHSPSGLTWVSTEPWGWVTYHYGGWDLAPGWGWVWYPGPVYTPASVFWYWGPTHIGWVPRHYYTNYYSPGYYSRRGYGSPFGVFGWAGGRPHHWAQWTFCKHRHFGHHRGPQGAHYGSYHQTATQLSNLGALQEVPRGVIAADTRAITPGLWNRPTDAMQALTASRVDSNGNRVTGELTDVTAWVARSRQLPPQVEHAVMPNLRGDSSTTSPTNLSSGSATASQRPPAIRTPGNASERRLVATGGVSAPRPSENPDASDWRNRRTLGSSSTATSQTPTARRVWDGVRSYRERSRQDNAGAIRPSYRSSGGGLGSSPGYGAVQSQRSWSERSTPGRYFGGFGSSPGYGSSQPQSTWSRPSSSRFSSGGSGSSPGYSGSQGRGAQSRSVVSRPGKTPSGSSARGRGAGSSPTGGRRSGSGGRTSSSSATRGSSSPPPR